MVARHYMLCFSHSEPYLSDSVSAHVAFGAFDVNLRGHVHVRRDVAQHGNIHVARHVQFIGDVPHHGDVLARERRNSQRRRCVERLAQRGGVGGVELRAVEREE